MSGQAKGSSRAGWRLVVQVALGVLAGVVAAAGAIAVTVAGFALSFDAIRAVGRAAHMRHDWAWLLPVSVDGAMAVATVAAVVLHRLNGKTARYPWAVVGTGVVVSVLCNGLHAMGKKGVPLTIDEREIRFAVSAIPAVMLALSVHLLVVLIDVVATKVEEGAQAGRAGSAQEAQPVRAEGAQGARVPAARSAQGAQEAQPVRADDARASAQAREVYAQSVAAEMPLSGRALARMFDRSPTWGRTQINAVKAAERADGEVSA